MVHASGLRMNQGDRTAGSRKLEVCPGELGVRFSKSD